MSAIHWKIGLTHNGTAGGRCSGYLRYRRRDGGQVRGNACLCHRELVVAAGSGCRHRVRCARVHEALVHELLLGDGRRVRVRPEGGCRGRHLWTEELLVGAGLRHDRWRWTGRQHGLLRCGRRTKPSGRLRIGRLRVGRGSGRSGCSRRCRDAGIAERRQRFAGKGGRAAVQLQGVVFMRHLFGHAGRIGVVCAAGRRILCRGGGSSSRHQRGILVLGSLDGVRMLSRRRYLGGLKLGLHRGGGLMLATAEYCISGLVTGTVTACVDEVASDWASETLPVVEAAELVATPLLGVAPGW
uniref:Uncharacterized protein n=1 Tax=Anopheles coluzzii TaxID=1518534 RepID=A0A8W7Q0J3_ANOCL